MNQKLNSSVPFLLCVLVAFAFAPGCESETGTQTKTPSASTSDHDHDHADGDHDHDHADHDHADHDHADHDHEEMGQHGGHLAHFDGGKGSFEWAHNDSASMVTIYLLGDDEKTLKPVAATKAVITATSGEKTKEFVLEPSDEADGKTATFQLEDPALIAALQLGVTLIVDTADGQLKAEIKPHVH